MSDNQFSDFNYKYDVENDNYVASITSKVIQQIVAEEDEYTLNMIEEYIKDKRAKGECIAAKIIPEGKLRHIINLGLSVYNENTSKEKILNTDLFPQEQYIEFLRREILKLQSENQKLRNQMEFEKGKIIMEDIIENFAFVICHADDRQTLNKSMQLKELQKIFNEVVSLLVLPNTCSSEQLDNFWTEFKKDPIGYQYLLRKQLTDIKENDNESV